MDIFELPQGKTLPNTQVWELNKRWLDEAIARGDDFILATGTP